MGSWLAVLDSGGVSLAKAAKSSLRHVPRLDYHICSLDAGTPLTWNAGAGKPERLPPRRQPKQRLVKPIGVRWQYTLFSQLMHRDTILFLLYHKSGLLKSIKHSLLIFTNKNNLKDSAPKRILFPSSSYLPICFLNTTSRSAHFPL